MGLAHHLQPYSENQSPNEITSLSRSSLSRRSILSLHCPEESWTTIPDIFRNHHQLGPSLSRLKEPEVTTLFRICSKLISHSCKRFSTEQRNGSSFSCGCH